MDPRKTKFLEAYTMKKQKKSHRVSGLSHPVLSIELNFLIYTSHFNLFFMVIKSCT